MERRAVLRAGKRINEIVWLLSLAKMVFLKHSLSLSFGPSWRNFLPYQWSRHTSWSRKWELRDNYLHSENWFRHWQTTEFLKCCISHQIELFKLALNFVYLWWVDHHLIEHQTNLNVFVYWWLNSKTLILASNEQTSNIKPIRPLLDLLNYSSNKLEHHFFKHQTP